MYIYLMYTRIRMYLMPKTHSLPENWALDMNMSVPTKRKITRLKRLSKFLRMSPLFLGARSNSTRLRADVDNLQTQCANDMWSSWNNTNTSLQQRVTESTEAHNKLQSHLSKEMQEIYDQVHKPYFNIF